MALCLRNGWGVVRICMVIFYHFSGWWLTCRVWVIRIWVTMPKIGSIEFEKINMMTPAERMGKIMIAVDDDWRSGIAEKRRERAVEIHPANSRYDELSGIVKRLEAGLEVAGSISRVIEEIEADPQKGSYSRIIGFWYQFAREHPELLSAERVKDIWREAISLEERPIFKLDNYCAFVELTGERDEQALAQFELEVVEELPSLIDLQNKENVSSLEFLLRTMASLRGIGVSTSGFEKYFESLVEEVDLASCNVWTARQLFDFMSIYHKESGEVAQTIKAMVGHILTKGSLDEYNRSTLLEGASDDLASLDDFESAGEYWKQYLVLGSYPHVDCPSALIGCAIRTGNVSRLDEYYIHQRGLAEAYSQGETEGWMGGDVEGYKQSILSDVSNAWEQGWLLALRFHCSDDDRLKYLESGLILPALSAGRYDNSLEILLEFCIRHPDLARFRKGVERRIEIGLNRINKGGMHKDSLRAVDFMKAAIRWQKEVVSVN